MLNTSTQRSMCLLNEFGDTTISWDAENDDRMLSIIEHKMKAGITFFKIEPQFLVFKKKTKISLLSDIGNKREVVVSDSDFSELFKEGIVSASSRDTSSEIKTIGVAKTAAEVVQNHTVGIRRHAGG